MTSYLGYFYWPARYWPVGFLYWPAIPVRICYAYASETRAGSTTLTETLVGSATAAETYGNL